MANIKSEIPHKDSVILWQDSDNYAPEQALLIEYYENALALSQGDNVINLNYESLQQLKKLLVRH